MEIEIPLHSVTGPGSQPPEADGASLEILRLPEEMNTWTPPPLPDPEAAHRHRQAVARLEALLALVRRQRAEAPPSSLDLGGLSPEDLAFVDQILGEGEVSIRVDHGAGETRIQESVMAGIWRVRRFDGEGVLTEDRIETGAIPEAVEGAAAGKPAPPRPEMLEIPPGVQNAPPLLVEIAEQMAARTAGAPPHVINLTLLPQTEADLAFLADALGSGRVRILSRGYGNCRIDSTAVDQVWWVRYFNSRDRNILTTIEVGEVPRVACAAGEDLADSAMRLDEILSLYR